MNFNKSDKLFEEAKKLIPGGVNSPARAFGEIGITPPFMVKAKGSKIWDEDGNEYIDYIGSWGPMILGHSYEPLVEALKQQVELATSFGAPTELEVRMAKLVTEIVPSVEMIRMVNSGTEATMSAIRLARGFTGRNKIIKFAGNYHGHSDSFLIQAGSGALTHGYPSSPGVPQSIIDNTIIANFNDIEGIKAIFEQQGEEIAALIMEPVVGNMGVVPATQEFVNAVREITEKYGTLLIFDEVMTGFRVRLGCAQELYNVKPDLTCFGKIIGGGLPVGAYGGRLDIMQKVSPVGPVYQAGTLSGNPLAMTAGYLTLKTLIDNPEVYISLEEKSAKLQSAFETNIKETGIEAKINRVGSMITLFFTGEKVADYTTAKLSDTKKFAKYFISMLNQGIYLPPSQFEAFFISNAHSEEDLNKTIEANLKALKGL